MKTCPKCKSDQNEFSKNRSRPDGLSVFCKACMKEYFKTLSDKPKVFVKSKVCNTCKVEKDRSEFTNVKKSLDGLCNTCKECTSVKTKKKLDRDYVYVEHKVCTRCKEDKHRSEFGSKAYTSDGLNTVCKTCNYADFVRYRENNPEKRKASMLTQRAKISHKLASVIRSRLRSILKWKGRRKITSAVEALGCTPDEFREYLESKFMAGMTWDNWSYTGWHIDHIRPLSSFNLEDPVEFAKAFHYTNTQPLWAHENQSKRASLDWEPT